MDIFGIVRVVPAGVVIVLALGFGACQGESEEGQSESVTAGCERYASLVCEPMSACWPSHFWGWYGDLASE